MLHSEICALCIKPISFSMFLSEITVACVNHFIAKTRDYVVSPEFMTTCTLSFEIDLTSLRLRLSCSSVTLPVLPSLGRNPSNVSLTIHNTSFALLN